ncbi:MAG: hypothetical protein CMJ18_01555 [Phycisphaeraceae bacterium]|nr:hypothetical protein [Phycisphaeraceae bacterium]
MTVLAAPFLRNPELQEMLQSLATIDRVRVSVHRLPPELRRRQMTREAVRKQLEQSLERGGVRVVETGVAPRVELLLVVATDPDVAGALAFNVRLMVHQTVLVDRLQRRLTVPTFADFVVGIEPEAEMTATVRSSIDVLAEKLTRAIRAATAVVGRQPGNVSENVHLKP